MASFYYYDQNPFRFSFHIKICNPSNGLNNKFTQESKTLKDSGRSGKMMSWCKWPIGANPGGFVTDKLACVTSRGCLFPKPA